MDKSKLRKGLEDLRAAHALVAAQQVISGTDKDMLEELIESALHVLEDAVES